MPPGSDADHALAQVGVDPRTALAEADAIVARLPGRARPTTCARWPRRSGLPGSR